jgi:hypothetical protein
VVLGVVGELIGDAGIFETSARLSVLQNAAIDQAKAKAANAEERAGSANERAAKLEREPKPSLRVYHRPAADPPWMKPAGRPAAAL